MNFARGNRFASVLFLLIGLTSAGCATHTSQAAADKENVTQAVRTMYVALTNDDAALFRSVTAPGFYAFDVGKRFDGDALSGVIRNAHAAGKLFVWQVTDPDVHVNGDRAWIAYVNRGSVQDASGTTNLKWLESAFLRRDNGVWRIEFFHSTRAAAE